MVSCSMVVYSFKSLPYFCKNAPLPWFEALSCFRALLFFISRSSVVLAPLCALSCFLGFVLFLGSRIIPDSVLFRVSSHQSLVPRNGAKKRRIGDDNADSEWSKGESESSASEEESAGFAGSGIFGSTSLVECPGLSTTIFGTWKAFSEYFETYASDTYQPFRIRDTVTVEAMNKKTRTRCTSGVPSVLPYYCGTDKEKTKPIYTRTYICTHGGKPRYRGKKQRKLQSYRSIGCRP
ncbi:hypothetical protein F444_21817 [Phytophthora nicotianae P1976]|uniref:FAR1 domain-containing protein n=1 Tax=Phytophthora nicotianae P1976 TaxID=1317066 RepID=A0A080YZX2_PHYNI|nr:hypothetical protein F444_21817 [Phytophthora nicotianae P1976]